jgi:sortase A
MRRALRAISVVLIVAGALALVDGALTLLWEEPVSSLYARVQQEKLDGQLAELEHAESTPVERRAMAQLPDRTDEGDAIGRLRADAIGLDTVVVEGTGSSDLRKGPGHYPDAPLPGQRGTVAIAGHRTTYGAPFRNVDDLDRGDAIELAMPYGRFVYRVERTRIVPPTALWVTRRVAYDRLVLTACHPLYSAAQRIVVFARLVRATPRGAAA